MESMVASTITANFSGQGLGNRHQWACKKGHSTELLLAGDWRRVLDRKYVVGVISVVFRKAFDAIPPLRPTPKTSESWCSWRLMVLG